MDFYICFYPTNIPKERIFLTSQRDVWLVEKIDRLFLRSVGTFGKIDDNICLNSFVGKLIREVEEYICNVIP